VLSLDEVIALIVRVASERGFPIGDHRPPPRAGAARIR
jgi:hypothetical protein